MWVIDTECYSNVWFLAAKHKDTKQTQFFQVPGMDGEDRQDLKDFMKSNHTVSFNGIKYDLPMIAHAASGASSEELKALSDLLITSGKPSWQVCNEEGISVPESWLVKHIDLIEVAPGMASLKIYGGRLNCPKMQDLPLDVNLPVPDDKLQPLIDYCFNDLEVTELLLNTLWQQLQLRDSMSKKYGINLRSKSDAQIAEGVIRSLVQASLGKQLSKPKTNIHSVYYEPPEYIQFKSPHLQEVLERIKETEFMIHVKNGSVCMPEWLADTRIRIDGAQYQMGIGGLHSCEKQQYIAAGDDHVLADWDVASMYPTMIINQNLAPENMGGHFTKIYKGFVTQRLAAKHSGDKVTSDTLKIFLNGSFGKFGSMYSMLYSPKLLIQTTITGQLSLLMLIETVTEHGIRVMSANTDGVVMYCPKEMESLMDELTFGWMMTTDMMLERTSYKALASRDVNNYCAVKPDGKVKGKGIFAPPGLMKNPDRIIIYDAVSAFLAKGTPIAETIHNCTDITRFVTVRKVSGGAMWRDEEIGKAIRFYHSADVPKDECIVYAKNQNKVPNSDGCRPLMQLPNTFPDDVDYDYYIEQAEELLHEVGYHA